MKHKPIPYERQEIIRRERELAKYANTMDSLFCIPFTKQGIGRQFLQFVAAEWKGKAKQLRLEVEPNNVRAKALYERMGYKVLPYQEMILSLDEAE